jgi:RNA polymerase sigma-70 factor (ECF subfamily)
MANRQLDQRALDRLDQIKTDWSLVFEPAHVVMRYAHAVQCYLNDLLCNQHDAEEVAQDFFLWVSQHGLPRASKDRGRFRDYLKKVVRNKALNFLRKKKPDAYDIDLLHLAAPDDAPGVADQEWVMHWRSCLFRRAWRRLERYQNRSPKGRYFTVLHLCATHPSEDSRELAARASSLDGRTITAAAFRKQVSRARRVFAEMLVHEVAKTLDQPSPTDVEQELVDLGLMTYVHDYLPIRHRDSEARTLTQHSSKRIFPTQGNDADNCCK